MRSRLVLSIVLLAAAVGAAGAAPTVAAADGEPGVAVTATPDPLRGGTVFTIDLLNLVLPASEDYLAVYVTKDGNPVTDDPFVSSIDTPCPADDDPSNDPEVTHSCSIFLRAAASAGEYVIEVFPYSFGDLLTTTATVDTDIQPWWNDYVVTDFHTDMFTGATELSVDFTSVPAGLATLELGVWIDTTYSGFPTQRVGSIPCTEDDGRFTCATDGNALPAQCVADAGGPFCDDQEYRYWFSANDIPLPLSYQAILFRLSRYDEGVFFAGEDHAARRLLQDAIDLDTFVLGDSEPCQGTNLVTCYDFGYYTRWMQLYTGSFVAAMSAEGTFDVDVDGTTATVRVDVPRLPVGAHGLHPVVRYAPVGAPWAAQSADVSCDTAGCTDVVIPDLPPGGYRFRLQLFNDHPAVDVLGYYGEPIAWGQEVVAAIDRLGVVHIGSATPVVTPLGFVASPEGDDGATVWQLPVRLSAPSAVPVSVPWSTVDDAVGPGLASAGGDFVAASGTLVFAPGQTVAHVPIEIVGDEDDETPLLWGEWGLVRFGPPTNAVLDTATLFGHGAFIILDDD